MGEELSHQPWVQQACGGFQNSMWLQRSGPMDCGHKGYLQSTSVTLGKALYDAELGSLAREMRSLLKCGEEALQP